MVIVQDVEVGGRARRVHRRAGNEAYVWQSSSCGEGRSHGGGIGRTWPPTGCGQGKRRSQRCCCCGVRPFKRMETDALRGISALGKGSLSDY